jgi:endonuclease G
MKLIKHTAIFISLAFFGMSCKKGSSDDDFLKDFQNQNINVPLKKAEIENDVEFDFLPESTTKQVIKHSYFCLSYKEESEQAEWVAYFLRKDYLKNNNYKRPYFMEDKLVVTGSADWRNYKNSGFDKGHLCPAGDMGFDLRAYNETFLTSNISPQDHVFNAGIWNRLEQKVRYWADKYDGVYVVTGGVLNPSLTTIGTERVAVPEQFYKIILDESNGGYKIIAFLMPNRASDKPLFNYVVSVDYIEKLTGIDFFPALNDSIENKLEKAADTKPWFSK